MKIRFRFLWMKAGAPVARGFREDAAFRLFTEFSQRLSHFAQVETVGAASSRDKRSAACRIWFCDRAGQKPVSSEDLAERVGKLRDEGIRELEIVLGGADGFSEEDRELLHPDFLWNFGPLTLPHELAAVVAAEQMYRAWSILGGLPYHH